MQQLVRPYANAGVALVGAGIIAVIPVVAPPDVQTRAVRLVDAWSDLATETAANLQSITNGSDPAAISQVFAELLTNPLGVLGAATNLEPTITTGVGIPAQISVELPPGLELGIAQLSSELSALDAVNGVVGQLTTDPANAFSTLYEAPAVIANAFLNGEQNVSLLDGIINIPALNGVLAPLQSATIDVNLAKLVDALGLGNLGLGNLDLSSLLNQLGLGDLTVGSLFSDLGLSGKGLGDLLGNPTLSAVLTDLGLGKLNLGTLDLTSILSGLGLNPTTNLNSLTLDQILTAFGINPNVEMPLGQLLDNLGFSTLLDTKLGTELSNLGALQGVLTDLNGILGSNLLSLTNLETALNSETVGDLLGGQTLNQSLGDILTALGVSNVTPSGLTVGTLLEDARLPQHHR